ncbi:MAG: J domain-containing protein [Candidatus Nitrotoga sp.]|nr:J domain-containing protein [Candidatus Nitrotoga sp.]MDO9447912.1 J domain-containing protein [Candidatus Nitrotoga sp.]MDP3496559.1 J domain-containing protein [Candidatus Nitrotoga sp.]
MLPEEQELIRLESEQAELEEQVTSAELTLETSKTETAQFQHRYHQTVGRLYAQLDEMDALLARVQAGISPDDAIAQAHAQAAEQQAKASAEEAGMIEAQPAPPPVITPELKLAFRQAAKLMHPDRATNEPERLRRTKLMAQVNLAYERGDQQAIEKLVKEYGQDPEAITGGDVASRIVKSIRRIAQLRRRMGEVQQQIDLMQQAEIFYLKQTIEETEAMGGDPLGDLVKQLMQELSERKIQLEIARQETAANV